jgi:hypothetical protein
MSSSQLPPSVHWPDSSRSGDSAGSDSGLGRRTLANCWVCRPARGQGRRGMTSVRVTEVSDMAAVGVLLSGLTNYHHPFNEPFTLHPAGHRLRRAKPPVVNLRWGRARRCQAVTDHQGGADRRGATRARLPLFTRRGRRSPKPCSYPATRSSRTRFPYTQARRDLAQRRGYQGPRNRPAASRRLTRAPSGLGEACSLGRCESVHIRSPGCRRSPARVGGVDGGAEERTYDPGLGLRPLRPAGRAPRPAVDHCVDGVRGHWQRSGARRRQCAGGQQ